MGTEKIQTQIRKDQIVRAVLDLISRHGLKALNVAAVAAEIGLVPSALYRHFKGKEEMVGVVPKKGEARGDWRLMTVVLDNLLGDARNYKKNLRPMGGLKSLT